jgi:hypothetical protein
MGHSGCSDLLRRRWFRTPLPGYLAMLYQQLVNLRVVIRLHTIKRNCSRRSRCRGTVCRHIIFN